MDKLSVVDFTKGVSILAIVIAHQYEGLFGWNGVPNQHLCSFTPGGILGYFDFSTAPNIYGILKVTVLGWQGVPVFIIMAGFLAVWSIKDREFNPFTYLGRRLYRLYPLYWITLLAVLTLNMLLQREIAASPADILGMFVGYYPLSGSEVVFLDVALWFITLIIQFYIFFPILRGFMVRLGNTKFLLLMGVFAYFFTWTLANVSPLAGQFFGCWLIEFSFGMVMATKFEEFNRILSHITVLIPLALAYAAGFYLSGFLEIWPLARPLYGISLTLSIWTIFYAFSRIRFLKSIAKVFVFIGVNSFALYLVHQPFIHQYFLFVTSFTGDKLYFNHIFFGSRYNVMNLPPERYILIMVSYCILMISLSYILTKFDGYIHRLFQRWTSKPYPTPGLITHSD